MGDASVGRSVAVDSKTLHNRQEDRPGHAAGVAKRDAILGAANEQFRQYGFRKTSMDDISTRLGISRASLYSYFGNKDEIFRGVSIAIHEEALRGAESHLADSVSARNLRARVQSALLARHGPFQSAVTESAHGSELFDEHGRLCGDIVADAHVRFQTMLAAALNAASRTGEIDLKGVGIAATAAAEILNLAAAGLKQQAPDLATYKNRVVAFVKVFVAGLG
jgi:AcrR family transcriptional regulator